MNLAMITEEMKGAMQGVIPSSIVTCSQNGIPNITYISQVYFVDETHVAISHQFFNKSIRNFYENPGASVNIVHPDNFDSWKLDLRFSHTESEGELFEQMSAQLEAIASMTGMEDVFRLKACEIFEVTGAEKIT